MMMVKAMIMPMRMVKMMTGYDKYDDNDTTNKNNLKTNRFIFMLGGCRVPMFIIIWLLLLYWSYICCCCWPIICCLRWYMLKSSPVSRSLLALQLLSKGGCGGCWGIWFCCGGWGGGREGLPSGTGGRGTFCFGWG